MSVHIVFIYDCPGSGIVKYSKNRRRKRTREHSNSKKNLSSISPVCDLQILIFKLQMNFEYAPTIQLSENRCMARYKFYLFIYYWIYIPPSHANTSEWSAGSRVCCLGPFSGFQLCIRSSVCYRTPSLQPKHQTTGVNYTALHDHSLLQPYRVQPTLLACQCRGPRIKSQICLGDRELNPGPFAPEAECVTTRPPRLLHLCMHLIFSFEFQLSLKHSSSVLQRSSVATLRTTSMRRSRR